MTIPSQNPEGSHPENKNQHDVPVQKDTISNPSQVQPNRPTLEDYLRMAEVHPKELDYVARNMRNRCEATLRRWQEAGYPNPGEWPDNGDGQIVLFAYLWMINGPFSRP